MTAKTLMEILERNGQHASLLIRANDSIGKIVCLEGARLSYWYFDEKGNLDAIGYKSAPNGEMDLLAVYADDVECYGTNIRNWIRASWL